MSNVSLIDGHIDEHTNYYRIRNMSVEELADYIYNHDDMLNDTICKTMHATCPFGDNVEPENCKTCIKQWLESEVTK